MVTRYKGNIYRQLGGGSPAPHLLARPILQRLRRVHDANGLHPARSTMLRASLRVRWKARAERCNCCIAALSRLWALSVEHISETCLAELQELFQEEHAPMRQGISPGRRQRPPGRGELSLWRLLVALRKALCSHVVQAEIDRYPCARRIARCTSSRILVHR